MKDIYDYLKIDSYFNVLKNKEERFIVCRIPETDPIFNNIEVYLKYKQKKEKDYEDSNDKGINK